MKFARNIFPTQPLEILLRSLNELGFPFMDSQRAETQTVRSVDLDRFMGTWFVQSHTPLLIDDHSSNQTETYQLNAEGAIDVTYRFKRFGKEFTMHPEGKVLNKKTNAHWSMRFFKVVPSDYLIVRLAEDYSYTAVSVPGKKLVWIMSREKYMDPKTFDDVYSNLKKDGYAVETMRRVPQD
jgi:apolipoprotein D and lipocalin family protein